MSYVLFFLFSKASLSSSSYSYHDQDLDCESVFSKYSCIYVFSRSVYFSGFKIGNRLYSEYFSKCMLDFLLLIQVNNIVILLFR